MSSGLPQVYLDTNIFQPLLYNSDTLRDERFAQRILESLRGDVSHGNIEVVIPKPAIGEAVDNFYEDHEEYGVAEVGTWREFASKMEDYINQVNAELCGISQDAVKIANRLITEDSRLSGTDAIIAGCALDDMWSNHLITDDSDFHETNAIQEIQEEQQPRQRFHELNIVDSY